MKITLEINNKAINAFKKAFNNITKPYIKKARKAYKKANIAKISDNVKDKLNKLNKQTDNTLKVIKKNISIKMEK